MTGKKKQAKQAAPVATAAPVEAAVVEAVTEKAPKKGKSKQVDADALKAAELAKAQQLAEEQAAAKAAAAAALAESQSWAVVVDPRKAKQQARLERKKAQLEVQKIEELPVGAPVPEAPKPKKEKADKKEQAAVPSSSHVAKLKKKAKSSKPANTKPKTEAELVVAISKILESVPTQFCLVSAVGDKMQSQLNCSWNTQFKPQFGTLNDFLSAHTEAFHVTADGKVYDAKQYAAIIGEKKEKEREVQQKKAASQARKAESQPKAANKSHAASREAAKAPAFALPVAVALGGLVLAITLYLPSVRALLRL